jgi:hypothetical protein
MQNLGPRSVYSGEEADALSPLPATGAPLDRYRTARPLHHRLPRPPRPHAGRDVRRHGRLVRSQRHPARRLRRGAADPGLRGKVAELLGFEAAVFCISGTMAQVTALRLAAMARPRPVALHPTSHIFVHERSNYQLLGHFDALQVGDRIVRGRPPTSWRVSDRLAAVGARDPDARDRRPAVGWDDLQAIKAHCRAQGIHLHMDGARLWEAAAGYGRPVAEIAAGFDSVYVSLYKGIGGLGGAMLPAAANSSPAPPNGSSARAATSFTARPTWSRPRCSSTQRLAAMPATSAARVPVRGAARPSGASASNPARPAGQHAARAPAGEPRARAGDPPRAGARPRHLAVQPRQPRRAAGHQLLRAVRGRQPARHAGRPRARGGGAAGDGGGAGIG